MRKWIFLVWIMAATTTQANVNIITSAQNGKIAFEAIGKPSMLKIKGQGDGAVSALSVNANKLSGAIKFNLNSLKTGIALRDEHMKEKYLQVDKNSQAVLIFKDFTLPVTWSIQNPVLSNSEFVASLQLHGVEKPVHGHFNIESNQLKSNANFEIKLSEFNIEIPEYLGVKIADIVKVSVDFEKMSVQH